MLWWSWGGWPDVLIDFGHEVYIPWRLSEGARLYADIAYVQGPLSAYWNALVFRLLGVHLHSIFAANLVIASALTLLLYWLARRVADAFAATLACLVFLCLFACAQYLNTGNYNYVAPYSHPLTHGLVLAIAAIASLERFFSTERRHWLDVPVVVFAALAEALPERVMAGAGSPLWNCTQSGLRDDGTPYTSVLFINGGLGATIAQDGENTLSWPSNISSTPVEVMERISPFFVAFKRLTPNSGGKGRFRGGLGQEMLMINEAKSPITVTFLGERTRIPAPGFAGGEAGGLGAVIINGEPRDTREMHYLEQGDRLLMRTPAGGGFGPASERDGDAEDRDRKLGYVE